MNSTKIAKGVKQYVQDLFLKVKLMENSLMESDDEEFYKSMLKHIEEYAKTHKLFIAYTLQKISFNNVKSLLGFGDRKVYRYLEEQRKRFISFIEEKENELLGETKWKSIRD